MLVLAIVVIFAAQRRVIGCDFAATLHAIVTMHDCVAAVVVGPFHTAFTEFGHISVRCRPSRHTQRKSHLDTSCKVAALCVSPQTR